MDINTNSYIPSYHPVGVQAGLRTEPQTQGRGPDSVPPSTTSSNSSGANTNLDPTRRENRLDVYA